MMMIEVKVASLTTVVSLKYLQSNHKMNLNYNSSVNYLHWTVRSVLQLLPLICQQRNTNEKKLKEGDQIEGKNMAMLVFNPCIMVFSPLFNVIMLTLTILRREHSSSVFWWIANWSEHHELWLLMLRLLLGGKGMQRVILLHRPLWCLRTMWEKMDFLLSHHTLLISMTPNKLIIWHLIQQCLIIKFL